MADLEIAVRDRIGWALRVTGSALYRLGLELHGLSGWWDAVTDSRKMRKDRRVAEARGLSGRAEG